MRPNLVIVRGGRGSLHPRWLEGGERNWDLLLCPYQDTPPQSDFPVPPPSDGQKWVGLDRMLNADDTWRRYDYVWLPDDDLLASAPEISRFFDLCHRFNSLLAQPALTEESYFSFAITMRNRAFFARATTFVEVMAPCFRREALERVLPILAEADSGWGWGLSYAWAKAFDYRGIHIFDAAPVRHTRPVGKARSRHDHQVARAEWARMLSQHNAVPTKRSLFACDEAGGRIALSDGRFLIDYVGGYNYLIERDPRLMFQIVRDQIAPERPWSPPASLSRGRLQRWFRMLRRGDGAPKPRPRR